MRKYLLILLLTITFLSGCSVKLKTDYKITDMDYSESTDLILNPEKGFYQPLAHSFKPIETEAIFSKEMVNRYLNKSKIFHLRLGLEAYSTNAKGKDSPISNNTLTCLRNTLDVFREIDANVIIRFSYNVNGHKENNKYLNAEPALELILKHIEQISSVLNDYKDVISSVETGMLGPWGEQHSTTLADSSNNEAYYKLVDKWLTELDKSFSVTVRRPLYFLYWVNAKYNLETEIKDIANVDFKALGSDVSRVGCYNDGYLGSSSDLGTYKNRDEEIKWLSINAQTTFFGGEVVADSETSGIGKYNCVNYLEKEAFQTHTTYLNYCWNYEKVISVWETQKYSGSNKTYNNGEITEYNYVNNHLGYNLVLKSSYYLIDKKNNQLFLKGSIENNGFGNVINQKKVEIVLQTPMKTIYKTIDFDIRAISSLTTKDFNCVIPLEDLTGECKIFMKVSSAYEKENSNLRCIRFANNSKYYNQDLGANYLGDFNL